LDATGGQVGLCQIRHRPACAKDLPEACKSHVYYETADGHENRGIGTAILAAARQEAARLGIEELLVSCLEANIGSLRVIQHNGGTLTREAQTPHGKMLIFSVPLLSP